MTQELTQATNIINKAKSLTVHTNEEATTATEVLSRANKALDLLETREHARTERLKAELAFIREPYLEPKKALKGIIADLRQKLGDYQTTSLQQAAKEAEAIATRVEEGTLKPVTAIRKLDAIDVAPAKIAVQSGSLSFRPKQTLKIVDVDKIPRMYMVPNEEMILGFLTNGKTIPGAEIEIIQVPINRRN